MATCRGVDVSEHQGPQDWATHKANGVVFGFAKASEGMRTRDADFAMHIKGIKAASLIPGGYHFAWPNQDVRAEAANYIAAVKPYATRGFVHWLDLERYSDGRNYRGCTDAGIRSWVAKWLALVGEAFPSQRVGVYTSGDDLAHGHLPDSATLWYPAYPGTRVDTYAEAEAAARPSPSGWRPMIWQFTSDPAGPGPGLDLNLCYMSAADMRAWAGGAATATATRPRVDLSKLIAAAKHDPAQRGTPVSYSGVKTVELALADEGLLSRQYVDGHFGTTTIAAYAAWQRRCGYTGKAADGIPGKTSLTKLGKRHGFTVVD